MAKRLWILFGLLMLGGAVQSEPLRVPILEDVFYYQPAASVFGVEALWTNPSSLARYPAKSIQFIFDYENGDFADSWGYALSGDRYASGWRIIRKPNGEKYKELLFGAGMGFGNVLNLGGSFRQFTEGHGIYDNRHFWTIGLSTKGASKFAAGAVWSNLNRGRVAGERSEIEQRYSLAVRPFGPRVTVASDMLFSTGNKPSEAEFRYHGEFIPSKGIFVNGYVDSERRWQLGLRLNLTKYFVGAKSAFNRANEELGTDVFVGHTSLRQESVISDRQHRLTAQIHNLEENPVQPVIGRKPLSFTQVLMSIYRAGDDPYIRELLLEIGTGYGFAQAEEVRAAVQYCRERGKEVTAYLTKPGNLSYFIGVAADRIVIPPVSQLNLTGLRAELTFFAASLAKLGVNVELLRIGKYKTAAETWTRAEATEENREQINRLLDELFAIELSAIANGRNMSVDSVREIIDGGPYTSAEALAFGLVDTLSYRDKLNGPVLQKLPQLSVKEYMADTLVNDDWQRRAQIGIVVIDGEISDGMFADAPGSDREVSPGSMKRAFDQANGDGDVKGLVLRINSPGGEALASDLIHHHAEEGSKRYVQPLVVSMGNTAASGGYYIATAGTRIFASPSTITGSIGIFGGKLDLSQLYKKIELGKELFTRGKYSALLTTIRPFTDDEREKYFSQLEAMYDHFLSLVSKSRGLEVDSVDAISQGQVWTGSEARRLGLVDENQGLKGALDYVQTHNRIGSYDVALFPRNRPLFVLPKFPVFSQMVTWIARTLGVKESEERLPESTMYLRMPYDIVFE